VVYLPWLLGKFYFCNFQIAGETTFPLAKIQTRATLVIIFCLISLGSAKKVVSMLSKSTLKWLFFPWFLGLCNNK